MNSRPTQTRAPTSHLSAVSGRPTPDIIPTDSLFQGRQEILISHKGEQYRLRITKNAKLILTK